MKSKTIKIHAPLVAMLLIILMSFNSFNHRDGKWEVPSAAKKMKNPTDKANKENILIGKSLYNKHCKSCHGKTGAGDGPKAAELDESCGDFTNTDFQSQTDGELFYKTNEGKDDMPSFKKKIKEGEDIWLIINHIRTLKE